jgi:cellulose synthase/poly-beta-1,6-N-acetylglucosamine synthase-like glycosyltransferase
MLIHALLFAIIGLGLSTVFLLLTGRRLGGPAWWGGMFLMALVAAASAWGAVALGVPLAEARVFLIVTLILAALIVWRCRSWNAIGQTAWLFLLMAGLGFFAVSAVIVALVPASPIGTALGVVLLLMQAVSLLLTFSFTFEILDVICRRRWRHPEAFPPRQIQRVLVAKPVHASGALPRVALHVPCHEEPPEVVAATLQALAQLDYPPNRYTVFVVDNNTTDPALWRPLMDLCDRYQFTFLHLEQWPGFKSGALNYALEATPPEYDIIGIVDADYLVHPDYLRDLVGYFADSAIAFVQTPQDYRDYGPDSTFYQRACYHAYRYFFDLSMPSRAERNAIIFGGTMGLVRRSALEAIGGWDEWCITEDAEASLRLLARGYEGRFINRSYGRGLMPLEFDALKRQRFRWCFGGIQILRKHWATLLPWTRRNPVRWDVMGLSAAQRYHYLLSGIQWFSDVVTLGFTALVMVTAALLLVGHPVHVPVLGTTLALLPLAFWGMGIARTLWALRATRACTWGEAVGALAILWSLSWVVALACMQGLLHRNGVFLRTPKTGKAPVARALRSTLSESLLAVACWTVGILVLTHPLHTPSVWWGWGVTTTALGISALVQGATYATAPIMCLLSLRTEAAARAVRQRAFDAEGGTTEWRLLAGALVVAGALSLAVVGASLLPGANQGAAHHQAAITQLLGNNPITNATATPRHPPTGGPTATPQPGVQPTGTVVTTPGIGTPTPTPPGSGTPTATPHPGNKPTPTPTTVAIATPTPRPGATPTPRPHATPTPHPHP